jgi:hypothetical protein
MTGGGQFPVGTCTRASFGGSASGVQGGTAKGHFNYVNRCTHTHFNGPVTAILLVDPLTKTMTFQAQSGACTATVTWHDGGAGGTGDTIQLNITGTGCPTDQTSGAVALTHGNIQWHSNVR